MTDTDQYIQQQTKILAELEDFENKGLMTKKEYIVRLKEVTRPLILSGYYEDVKLEDLCSFIGDLLKKYNIDYSTGHLAELFDDDEKRVQHRKNTPDGGVENSPPLSEKTESGITAQLDFLERQVGKSYDAMPDYDPGDKLAQLEYISQKNTSHLKSFTHKLYTANYFVSAFEKQFGSIEEAEKTCQGLPKKQKDRLNDLISIYHASVLLISEMETSLADINDNNIKELKATQAITSKEIDERNKLSTWEKLTIILAMKAGDIAKNQCAKLNGIDKKHITNNIIPEKCPIEPYQENKHHRYLSWFKNITIELNGQKHTLDITKWFERQIERKKLDLPFEPMILSNAMVE